MRMRVLVWSAVVVVMASACGGDDTATTTSSSTTSSTTTTTELPTTTSTTATTTTTVVPVTLVPSDPFVTTGGLGPIRVLMGVEEASERAGFALEGEPDPAISTTCYHVTAPADAPDVYGGVAFMVENDVIVRVEVRDAATATTRSGAGIGVGVDALQEMFPGQLESVETSVDGGVGLAFVPRDEEDVDYRVIFVIENDVVVEYWAGILPAVGYLEGCV